MSEREKMKANRRLLLAGAIAAAVILAVPAMALASVWKDGSTKVEKLVEIGLTGTEIFETAPTGETKNGMICSVHATLTTEGGSEGKISKFETKSCGSGFGSFAKCELSTNEGKTPWNIDVNTSDLTITGWHTKRTFKTGCPTTELNKTVTSVTVTLNTPAAITEMEWKGEITGYTTRGSFSVDAPNSGTYGIG
jgi:hypothetical protein